MSAAVDFPRSDFSTNDGPYLIGAGCQPSQNFQTTSSRLLTISTKGGSPKVHLEEYVRHGNGSDNSKLIVLNFNRVPRKESFGEEPVASKYHWDILPWHEGYSNGVYWRLVHRDSGRAIIAPDGVVVADASGGKKSTEQMFRVLKGSNEQAHPSQGLDQYTIAYRDASTTAGILLCHDNPDEIRMCKVNGEPTPKYEKRAPWSGFWYFRSVGPTQVRYLKAYTGEVELTSVAKISLLDKVKKLEKEKDAERKASDSLREDLRNAVNRADTATKEKDDALKRESAAKVKSSEAETELDKLRSQLKEAQGIAKQHEETCAAQKAALTKELDNKAELVKFKNKHISQIEGHRDDLVAELNEAKASANQQKESLNKEIASIHGQLSDTKGELDRLQTAHAALQRNHDKWKSDADAAKEKIRALREELTKAQSESEAAHAKTTEQEQSCQLEKEKLNKKLENAVSDRDRLKNEVAHGEEALHAAQKDQQTAEQDRDHARAEAEKAQKALEAAVAADQQQQAKAKADKEELEKQLENAQKSEKRKEKDIAELRHTIRDKEADEKAAHDAQAAAEATRDAVVEKAKNDAKEQATARKQDAQMLETLTADKEDLSTKLNDCRSHGAKQDKELDTLRRERPEFVRRADDANRKAQEAEQSLIKATAARKEAESKLLDEQSVIEDLRKENARQDAEIEKLRKQSSSSTAEKVGGAGTEPGSMTTTEKIAAASSNEPSMANGKDQHGNDDPKNVMKQPKRTSGGEVSQDSSQGLGQAPGQAPNGTSTTEEAFATSRPAFEPPDDEEDVELSKKDVEPNGESQAEMVEQLKALEKEIQAQMEEAERLRQRVRNSQSKMPARKSETSGSRSESEQSPTAAASANRPDAGAKQSHDPSTADTSKQPSTNSDTGGSSLQQHPTPASTSTKPNSGSQDGVVSEQKLQEPTNRPSALDAASSSATGPKTPPNSTASQPNETGSQGEIPTGAITQPGESQHQVEQPKATSQHHGASKNTEQPLRSTEEKSPNITQQPLAQQPPNPDYEQFKRDMEREMEQKFMKWQAEQERGRREVQAQKHAPNQAARRPECNSASSPAARSPEEVHQQTNDILDSIAKGGAESSMTQARTCTQCGRPWA